MTNTQHLRSVGLIDSKKIRRKLDKALEVQRSAALEYTNSKRRLAGAVQRAVVATEAHKLVLAVAQLVQENVHERFSGLVTRCLHSVFGPIYDFKILFEQKRGRTEARLAFFRDGEEFKPNKQTSGGVGDIVAFALRLVALCLTRPPLRRLLILDEPFKNVNGEEFQERMGDMIETVAAELGVQIIIVTDDEWLKIGKVVEL